MPGRSRPWGAVTTLITLVFAAVLGGAAHAQVQTGSILVKVTDEQGAHFQVRLLSSPARRWSQVK